MSCFVIGCLRISPPLSGEVLFIIIPCLFLSGTVLCNGIAMCLQFSTHYMNRVMAEHFAAFGSRDRETGQLNLT